MKTKITKLNANYSNGKYFTSASHLNDLFMSKAIKREIVAQRSGLHWNESTYRFTTHCGLILADVTKYSDHGFCSQAYGVEIPTNTLKDHKKENIEFEMWKRECSVLRKNKVIAKIAFIERGIQAFR